ncbi:hypothetical protein Pedsa_0500 [Pseudopedobacter saltans DSM 12145]|uniref:Lipocalin-like domain-containing protein n=1 Tax=Pseudopedobacter saltans (strain ATCC 51119 / DSM 12145 / JCM 21818 / CCUG 39354 / LMG 10337 / NBRC 100064 / NCIMB 13643) TaxID=762903 RepID=F0S6K5_PSESL|nr:hypothetical protein [Pseudopedobacter saltans]ADY51081.1 hypothetical protein Pedsa_0500 [Pseudopedobacter saltans DSM 12145]
MKKTFFLLISVIIIVLSCKSEEKEQIVVADFSGKWQFKTRVLIYTPGGKPNQKYTINDGAIFTFGVDSSFKSSKFNCEGHYSYESNILTINLPCDPLFINKKYNFQFAGANELHLDPQIIECDEGCYYILEKIR